MDEFSCTGDQTCFQIQLDVDQPLLERTLAVQHLHAARPTTPLMWEMTHATAQVVAKAAQVILSLATINAMTLMTLIVLPRLILMTFLGLIVVLVMVS